MGLRPLFSEVEISLEEISEKVETIYVFSPPYCQEIIPHKPPTSQAAEPPRPSPSSTCRKASQFAAHFVLDIKVEQVRASENNAL